MIPSFYPIVDTGFLAKIGTDPLDFASVLARAGVRIAQYRHKGEITRARFEEIEAIAKLFRKAGAAFIVNDRADIAVAVRADGVHIGQDDIPPGDARRIIGPDLLLGYSTHNAEQLAAAATEPVDYLAVGPIFHTRSKENPQPVLGVEQLPKLRSLTAKPLVAIGGVALENAAELLAAGADSLAVISALSEANIADWVRFYP